MSRYTPVCFSSRVSSRQHFQQTGLLPLSTVQRSSGSPGAGADVRHFSSLTTSEEQKGEKRGQRGGKKGHQGGKRVKLERDPRKINRKIVQLGRDHKWKEMLSLCQKQKDNFDNVNYATTMSQLGRSRSIRKDDPILKEFLDDLSKKFSVHGFGWMRSQGMANIVHAIGKMNLSGNDSAMRIVRRLEDNENATLLLKNGSPQAIANCVWACATLGIKSPNLFAELERNSTRLVQNGRPQEVANSVWACATLGIKSPNLFGELERNSTRLVENGNSQAIANCVWACAKLGIKSPNLFGELERNSTKLVQHGKPQEVANSVWACATLGIKSPNLFEGLERKATWLFQNGSSHDIANCVWACATLGIKSPNLFAELERNAIWLVENGNSQEVANCVWACATLGIKSPNLVREKSL